MSVDKKIINLLILIIGFIIPLSVSAEYKIVFGESQSAGPSWGYRKSVNGTEVLCTQFDRSVSGSCSSSKKLAPDLNAGVGTFVEWRNKGNNYICAEKLITKFMYNYYAFDSRENYGLDKDWVNSCGGTEKVKAIYNDAVDRYNKAKNIPLVSIGSSKLTFTESGDNFIAKTKVTGTSGYAVVCAATHAKVSLSNGVATITVPKSKQGQEISFTCRQDYHYKAPTNFYYNCNGQELISTNLENASIMGKNNSIYGRTPNLEQYILDLNGYLDGSISGTITGYGTADVYINGEQVADDVTDYYAKLSKGTTYEIKDIKEQTGKKYNGVHSGSLKGTINSKTEVFLDFSTSLGNLTIEKVNSNNDPLAQLDKSTTASFKLYNNSSCAGDYIKDFKAGETVTNITPGTYYLKEYETKKGYHLPEPGEDWYCKAITINSGNNKIKVENKTECEYEFRSNMTMKERIDLYIEIKDSYKQEFNALLNMNNIEAKDACRNIPVTKKYDKTCLGAESTISNESSFSETNVSMYTEKYGKYTFCLTKFKMNNEMGITNFEGIKTGQAIIRTDDIIARATLNRVCHNFGDENITDPEYNNLNYSNYIKDEASIGGIKLIKKEIPSGPINNRTITATYTLPVMYASNKDGRVTYGSCPAGEYCKVLGKGIISKFNLSPGKYDLNFDISFDISPLATILKEKGITRDCSYTAKNELINSKNKLNLEFRSVNTNSDLLFLSKTGTGNRKIGANWSNETDRNRVLKENNNSYNKNKEKQPLYKITLAPEIIKDIREENRKKTYDDYNMTCVEDGTICISNYLTCLQNENILFIKERTNIDKFENLIECK